MSETKKMADLIELEPREYETLLEFATRHALTHKEFTFAAAATSRLIFTRATLLRPPFRKKLARLIIDADVDELPDHVACVWTAALAALEKAGRRTRR